MNARSRGPPIPIVGSELYVDNNGKAFSLLSAFILGAPLFAESSKGTTLALVAQTASELDGASSLSGRLIEAEGERTDLGRTMTVEKKRRHHAGSPCHNTSRLLSVTATSADA